MKLKYNFKDKTSIEQAIPKAEEYKIGELFSQIAHGVNVNGTITIVAENLNETFEKRYSDVQSIELVLE